MEQLLTVKEVSRLTGYKESYVRKLLSIGKLKKAKLPAGATRVKVSDLKDFLGEVQDES